MQSQSGVKKFLEKIGTLILMAVLLFACTISSETSQSPVVKATKTKSSPTPNSPENDDPPTKTFSLQNANKIAPDDILKEVDFGGRGGPLGCDKGDFNYPTIDEASTASKTEWLANITVYTCGWQSDNKVSVMVELPNGDTITDTVEVKQAWNGIPFVDYTYYPDVNSLTGVYTFVFSGNSGNVEHSVNVSMPKDPRMYYINNIQSYYLYNFLPNEEIRFFLYNDNSAFGKASNLIAWERYVVDTNGRLIIKANEDEDRVYVVIGESSGPIRNGVIDASVIENHKSCASALPSRLEVGRYAYVATDPPLDQRVREDAGKNYSTIGYIAPGNPMKILDGPKCADGWAWWKVQSIKKPDLIGWTSEGDDVYWLIPCDSLNSCP